MAWVKVPPENHPLFHAALPKDPRIETRQMFGGIAASVNGHIFAGLFGRSTMLWLDEPERSEALGLEGASLFDPMGDGRKKSDKVMLPEAMMDDDVELRSWIRRAFDASAKRPPKPAKPAKQTAAKKPIEKKPAPKKVAKKAAKKRVSR